MSAVSTAVTTIVAFLAERAKIAEIELTGWIDRHWHNVVNFGCGNTEDVVGVTVLTDRVEGQLALTKVAPRPAAFSIINLAPLGSSTLAAGCDVQAAAMRTDNRCRSDDSFFLWHVGVTSNRG